MYKYVRKSQGVAIFVRIYIRMEVGKSSIIGQTIIIIIFLPGPVKKNLNMAKVQLYIL